MRQSPNRKERGFAALVRAMSSWRTAAVSLLSFSSGLPLGLVWYAIPDWMRDIGVDIRVVGLLTLAQAPWAFKVMWSPLMDRYVPPFWGRRRGWMAVTQVALAVLGLLLAGVGRRPEAIWVVGALALAIALASASQDIAIDAYAVEVLRTEEQGVAVGAKTAVYRAALVASGGAAITAASRLGWPAVNVLLALAYVPMLVLTWKAPEPEVATPAPRTLREAVWHPFLGVLARHRALEILAFVLLYKLADQLAQALTRPFLIDMGTARTIAASRWRPSASSRRLLACSLVAGSRRWLGWGTRSGSSECSRSCRTWGTFCCLDSQRPTFRSCTARRASSSSPLAWAPARFRCCCCA